MKILHVIPSVGPVRGGPSESVVAIAKAQNALPGMEAEIIATNDNGPNLLPVPLGELTDWGGAPIRFFQRFSPPLRPLWEFAFSASFSGWLWQHARDYDWIHVHAIFSYTCTYAMAVARHQGIPYIVRPNGMLCRWSLQQGARKKNAYLNLIERANLNGAAAIEFTAELERQEASALGLKAANFILPYGLEMPTPVPDARHRLRQEFGLAADEPVILFMSRIHPKKGLELLIEALGRLLTTERFAFILAGSGTPDYEAQIQAAIATAGLAERTHWAGFVQGERKNMLLQGADIFALTSHSESFGLAVLEAIAAGTQAVTTAAVPLASVVSAHQLGTVVPLTPEAIAAGLQGSLHSLQDTAAETARRHRARDLVAREYTWPQIAAKLVDRYATLAPQPAMAAGGR